MKNYLFLLLLTAFMLSCEKNDDFTPNEFEQIQIDNVMTLNGQSQRNAYVLLEPTLKHKIWVNKLNLSNDMKQRKLK